MRWLNKLSDVVNTIAEYFCAIALGVMSIVVFAQVVFRLTSGSLPWSEELARYLMIYMVYIGTSIGVKRCSHIAVEVVMDRCPPSVQKVVELLVDVLMMVAFVVICVYGFKIVNITMMQKSPAMQIKMGYVYMSMVIGGALMLLHCVNNMINTITGYQPEVKKVEGECEE